MEKIAIRRRVTSPYSTIICEPIYYITIINRHTPIEIIVRKTRWVSMQSFQTRILEKKKNVKNVKNETTIVVVMITRVTTE